jgi:hypothetical protein
MAGAPRQGRQAMRGWEKEHGIYREESSAGRDSGLQDGMPLDCNVLALARRAGVGLLRVCSVRWRMAIGSALPGKPDRRSAAIPLILQVPKQQFFKRPMRRPRGLGGRCSLSVCSGDSLMRFMSRFMRVVMIPGS